MQKDVSQKEPCFLELQSISRGRIQTSNSVKPGGAPETELEECGSRALDLRWASRQHVVGVGLGLRRRQLGLPRQLGLAFEAEKKLDDGASSES